jgi:hypothetical protein
VPSVTAIVLKEGLGPATADAAAHGLNGEESSMKARRTGSVVVASAVGLASLAAWSQARPPTTEQLGRDPGALRQEAEQQSAQERAQQQQSSQQQADQNWNDTLRQNQSRAAAYSAQGEAVRRT